MTVTLARPQLKGGNHQWTGIDNGYALVLEGSNRHQLFDSRDWMFVRKLTKGARTTGWELVVFGEVVDTYRTKTDAQCAAYTWL